MKKQKRKKRRPIPRLTETVHTYAKELYTTKCKIVIRNAAGRAAARFV